MIYSFFSSRRVRFAVCCWVIVLMFSQAAATASGDTYHNFREESSNKTEHVKTENIKAERAEAKPDYKIETRETDSSVIVIAIHGGKIEQGTAELAQALASKYNYDYYSYKGIKNKDNSAFHISSLKFAEPTALAMAAKSERTLSIHGCRGEEEFTYIGGLDTELRKKIKKSLTKHGFKVLDAPKRLAGRSPKNIVNRNMNGQGVQLEISKGLRTEFLAKNNDSLKNYVSAINEALSSIGRSEEK